MVDGGKDDAVRAVGGVCLWELGTSATAAAAVGRRFWVDEMEGNVDRWDLG